MPGKGGGKEKEPDLTSMFPDSGASPQFCFPKVRFMMNNGYVERRV